MEGLGGNYGKNSSLLNATPCSDLTSLKRARQNEYKDALDRQTKQLKEYRQGGNMTQAEKMLNRANLIAYKRGDETNYAMLPGVSPTKKYMDPDQYPEMSR